MHISGTCLQSKNNRFTLAYNETILQDATLELRVRTVKYFKDMWNVHASLNEDLSEAEMRKLSLGDYQK